MCFINECKCNVNYEWNSTTKECQPFICKTDSDCQTLDKNLICKLDFLWLHKSCQCDYGFVRNPKFNSCHQILSSKEEQLIRFRNEFILKNPYKKSCVSGADCRPNEFCFNNSCECEPNYAFDEHLMACIRKSCQSDNDCNQLDPKRICYNNSCNQCHNYYHIDTNTHLCQTMINKPCNETNDCTQFGDNHQICVDHTCLCRPNHRFNSTAAKCLPYKCWTDTDCQSEDPLRVCRSNSCKCVTNYREDIFDQKCRFDSFNLWFLWILWWLLIMPFILIIIVWFRRWTQHRISPSNGFNGSNGPFNSRTPIISNKNHYKTYL